MNETQYTVRLKYLIDDKAGAGVKKLSKEVEGLGDVSGKVVGLIAGIGGAFIGLESAKKHLIDFNSEVQNAKIGLSAMIQGNMGGSWDRATDKANALYNEFQKFSTLTPVTTQEIMTFGKSVAVSTFQAGGSIKQLTNITEQGVIAAKAFGYESAYSSLELSEMLAGNVNKRMMFAKQLLGIAKVDEKEFNAMSGQERLGVVQKVLNSDAMKNAAKAFGESWSGVTSTLEDKLQILVGKVGLPLFKRLTKEVQSWSDWIDHNTDKIEAFGAKFGSALVTGFEAMRTGIGFLVDHADTLLKIGELYAAIKIGGMLGGSLKNSVTGAGGGIAGLLASVRGPADRIVQGKYGDTFAPGVKSPSVAWNKGPGGALGAIPALGQAAGAGYAIGTFINEQTGASGKLADSFAHLTGRVDAATDHFDRMVKSEGLLEDAMAKRRNAGVGGFSGTTYNSNLLGMIDKAKADVNAYEDMDRAVKAMKSDRTTTSISAAKAAREAWDARGVTPEEAGREKAYLPHWNEVQTQNMATAMNGRWEAAILKLTDVQLKSLDVQQAQEEIMTYIAQTNDARQASKAMGGMVALSQGVADQAMYGLIFARNTSDKLSGKPNVNITIQRIEVQSDDPDRYAFGLVEAFRDAVNNPVGVARAAGRGV